MIHAVDFGTGAALAIHGPDGPVKKSTLQLPRVTGGKTPRDEFRLLLMALIEKGDVVVESPTVGSSGAEVDDVEAIVNASDHALYTISARAVKNYRMDHDLPNPKSYAKFVPGPANTDSTQEEAHVLDAEILYRIATQEPYRLRTWHRALQIERVHTSVRPMDKRGYRDERAQAFLALLPPFPSLPAELQASPVCLGDDYRPTIAVPFAMALTEPFIEDGPPEERRKRFQKVVGSYEHGYPSFYRRMYITWMQENARRLADVTRMSEVPVEVRKAAMRMTQKQMRHLFHLAS